MLLSRLEKIEKISPSKYSNWFDCLTIKKIEVAVNSKTSDEKILLHPTN